MSLQPALKFNGGGHINHTIFWTNLSPSGGGEPKGQCLLWVFIGSVLIDKQNWWSFFSLKEFMSLFSLFFWVCLPFCMITAVVLRNSGSCACKWKIWKDNCANYIIKDDYIYIVKYLTIAVYCPFHLHKIKKTLIQNCANWDCIHLLSSQKERKCAVYYPA